MSKLKEYENKSGYRIRATPKAYSMYYKKQGFYPVGDAKAARLPDKEATQEIAVSGMKVAELRKYLTDKGIAFDPKAKREELEVLVKQAAEGEGSNGADGVKDAAVSEDDGSSAEGAGKEDPDPDVEEG